ncbi:MAG: hypothetical protein DSY38_05350, partial [Fusobacteria bacterium]
MINSTQIYASTIYYFKEDIPPNIKYQTIYRIKIGAFLNLKNANKRKEALPYKSYILKGKRYFSLYIGEYGSLSEAIEHLSDIKKISPKA